MKHSMEKNSYHAKMLQGKKSFTSQKHSQRKNREVGGQTGNLEK